MKKVKFNEEIALEVFKILDKAWKEKEGVFESALVRDSCSRSDLEQVG